MNYKMIASDLDGTLLGADQRVSEENLAAIAELTERGVKFVPVTGRCIQEIDDDVKSCPHIKYVITSDGATVWDNERHEVAFAKYIPHDMVEAIINEINRYTTYPMAHENGDCFYDQKKHINEILDACHVNQYFRALIKKRDLQLESFNNHMLASDKVEMFCIFFPSEEDLISFKNELSKTGRLAIAQSDKYNLEIYSIEAGKGNTLLALANELDISKEEVIAVGDSINDVSMIRAAGLGLAMENAFAELKNIADRTICHYSEHSAKYILENFIKS